ncbi:MAG: penicillin-insensitive murein endopeptidase, partial [Nannocystaceae bacterium]
GIGMFVRQAAAQPQELVASQVPDSEQNAVEEPERPEPEMEPEHERPQVSRPPAGVEAKPSKQPLLVLATMVSDDPTTTSRVTMLDQERLRLASFRPGEPVRPGVTLKEIERGRVLLEEPEGLFALTVGNVPLAFEAGPTPGMVGAGTLAGSGLQVKPVKSGGLSVGRPNQGRLVNAVQLPDNPGVYRRTQVNASWGASHTIEYLQRAATRFRRVSGYRGRLLIGGISRQHGGHFSPHKSHQSGRDVDVVLPRIVGDGSRSVDWSATWSFVHTLIEDGQVTQIFLNYDRQRELYQAARAAGVSVEALERWVQYPKGVRGPGIVRHQSGHRNHLHIRFRCGAEDRRCSGW